MSTHSRRKVTLQAHLRSKRVAQLHMTNTMRTVSRVPINLSNRDGRSAKPLASTDPRLFWLGGLVGFRGILGGPAAYYGED